MQFRLTYRGHLPAKNNGSAAVKARIRREFAPQLRALLDSGDNLLLLREMEAKHRGNVARLAAEGSGAVLETTTVKTVGGQAFLPIASAHFNLRAELNILFLRPSPPGAVYGHGGDLDNRLKVLLDALCIPQSNQLPPSANSDPGYIVPVLLEDDALVTALRVETDRLLAPDATDQDVALVIHVTIAATRHAAFNSAFW